MCHMLCVLKVQRYLDVHRYATRGRSASISVATRRIGAIDWRDDGTTSLSKTSMENTVLAALREGRRISIDWCPDDSFPTFDDILF